MSVSRQTTAALLTIAVVGLAGCRESGEPTAPQGELTVAVDSDPQGAAILVNRQATGLVTPDTLRDLAGPEDTITVRLDTLGMTYGFVGLVQRTDADTTVDLSGPLLLRCDTDPCYDEITNEHRPNRVWFRINAMGSIFFIQGEQPGLRWPGASSNAYARAGSAMIAGTVDGDRVGNGLYNLTYLTGRPAPHVESNADSFRRTQSIWLMPAGSDQSSATIRGIEIDHEIVASSAVDDVVMIRLVFRNVTGRDMYRAFDPAVPEGGIAYSDVYIGFALDGDVGNHPDESLDDLLGYVPGLDMVVIYDADFNATLFDDGWANRPGLIGLRVLEAPDGAGIVLNGWPRRRSDGNFVDWRAGASSEPSGWEWMSGRQTVLPAYEEGRIGYVPESRLEDYRALVSAGPLDLAPGDSASITIAVVLAEPAEGEFESGPLLEPGDPYDQNRPFYRVAGPLIERAQAAEALLDDGS